MTREDCARASTQAQEDAIARLGYYRRHEILQRLSFSLFSLYDCATRWNDTKATWKTLALCLPCFLSKNFRWEFYEDMMLNLAKSHAVAWKLSDRVRFMIRFIICDKIQDGKNLFYIILCAASLILYASFTTLILRIYIMQYYRFMSRIAVDCKGKIQIESQSL